MSYIQWFNKRYGNDPADGDGGEGDGEGEGGGNGGEKKERLFKQKEVDDIIKKRLAKERTEKEKLLGQLQQLRDTVNLTEEQRSGLESQIQNLTDSLQSKEQQAAIALKREQDKYAKEKEGLLSERDTWRNRFVDSTIKRSLTDAAVTAGAQDPSQIVMMFGGSTSREEVKDSTGKPTGEFAVLMKFQGINPETKKPEQMILPVSEAVQHMRENKLHANLFKATGVPGTGTDTSGAGKGGKDSSKMPEPSQFTNPAEYQKAYQEWRDSYNLDGTPVKKD
jgi:hypothetical protein